MTKINQKEFLEKIKSFKAGDRVLFTGTFYTMRDVSHEKVSDIIKKSGQLPFDMEGSIIYYCGPSRCKPGETVGPCGPTTSSRMDKYTPLMLSQGVKAFVGKGPRSLAVKNAIKKFGAVYFVSTGGVGALLSTKVRKCDLIGFENLGPEAIYKFEVLNFPLTVAIDCDGNDIFGRF